LSFFSDVFTLEDEGTAFVQNDGSHSPGDQKTGMLKFNVTRICTDKILVIVSVFSILCV
jgi:hypothetical protein